MKAAYVDNIYILAYKCFGFGALVRENSVTKIYRIMPNVDGHSNPFARLTALLKFISNRRKDYSYPILPWSAIFKYLAIFLAVLALLLMYTDQVFLEIYREDKIMKSHIFEILTKIGKSNWILIATGICIIAMGFISGEKYTGKLHAVWHRVFFSTWFVFYSIGMSGIVTITLKFIFGRSRPKFVSGDNAAEFTPFIGGYDFASFPSGHSTTVGALIVCLVLLFPRFKIFIIILGLVIASTRSLVGAHFPSDVFCGLAVGASFTWLYARSMAKDRILFKFSNNGDLTLRKEGQGHCHNIPSMFLQYFNGKSGNPTSQGKKTG